VSRLQLRDDKLR